MDVVASVPLWRHPRAEAIQHDNTWYVAMPEQGQVPAWPRGIRLEDNDTPEASGAGAALDEILDDLYVAVSHDTSGQAQALARFVRRHGMPEICIHGLPIWHPGRPTSRSCTLGTVPDHPELVGAKVADIERLANTLERLTSAVTRTKRDSRVPDQWWQSLSASALDPEADPDAGSDVRTIPENAPQVRRQLASMASTLMNASGVTARMLWTTHRRPEIAFYTMSGVGLLVVEVVRQLGLDEPDRTYECSICGQPYTPQRRMAANQVPYCRRAECQRARNRINQAKRRARADAAKSEGERSGD